MLKFLVALLAIGAGPPVVNVRVAPSGQGLALEVADSATGRLANITGFAGLDESQSLAVAGQPRAQAVTLAFPAGTTAAIPFGRVPPSTAFMYNVALPAPGQYDIAVCAPRPYDNPSPPANVYSVYDGVLPVGQPVPVPFDLASNGAPGPVFKPIGRFAFATTRGVVEVSGALGTVLLPSAIQLTPVAGGPVITWTMDHPANTAYGSDRLSTVGTVQTNKPGAYGNGFYYFTVNVDSRRTAVTPTFWYVDAAAVGSAVAALPGYAGGVTVTSAFAVQAQDSGIATPQPPEAISLAFGGPLAATAIGLPTSSDPAVTPAMIHPGGQPLRYRINGGPPVPMGVGTWTNVANQGESYSYYPFPQSDTDPSAVNGAVTQSLASALNEDSRSITIALPPPSPPSVSPLPWLLPQNSAAAWSFSGLPPATYKVEVTWPSPAPAAYGPISSAVTVGVSDGVVEKLSGQKILLSPGGLAAQTATIDQTRAPSGVADPAHPGVTWQATATFTTSAVASAVTVAVTNASASGALAIADAVRVTRTSPDTSIRIGPTDVVTVDAPGGSILTTSGPSPALVAFVAPHAGASLLPASPTPAPKMRVGWNVGFEEAGACNQGHSDLFRRARIYNGYAATDATGTPVAIYPSPGSPTPPTLTIGVVDTAGTPTLPNTASGIWSIWWDEASPGSPTPPPTPTSIAGVPWPTAPAGAPAAIAGQATGNRLYFLAHDPYSVSPSLGLTLHSLAAAAADGGHASGVRNLRVYPPDPATGGAWINPPVWHPTYAARAAIGPYRALDMTGAAATSARTAAEAAQVTDWSLAMDRPEVTVGLVSIGPGTNSVQASTGLPFFNPLLGVTARVTTAAPHGLADFDKVALKVDWGKTLGTPTFAMNGGPLSVDFVPPAPPADAHTTAGPAYNAGNFFDGLAAVVHVTSTNSFEINTLFNRNLYPVLHDYAMVNTLTPVGVGALVSRGTNPRLPLHDIVALSAQSGQPPWIPIPANADASYVQALVDEIVAQLPPTTPLYIEYTNEIWNSTQQPNSIFEVASYALGLTTAPFDYLPSFMVRGRMLFDQIDAMLAVAGRGPVTRIYGSQQGDSGKTATIASIAVQRNIPVDVIAIGPYLTNTPFDIAQTNPLPQPMLDRWNAYTDEQSLDLGELAIEHGPMSFTFQDHLGRIAATGLKRRDGSPVQVWAYEGGIEFLVPGALESRADAATNRVNRAIRIAANPRTYRLSRRVLELAEIGGCSLWEEYRLGISIAEVQQACWIKYFGTYQPEGTGQATDPPGSSQAGGAYRAYSTAVATGTPTPVVPVVPVVPVNPPPPTPVLGPGYIDIKLPNGNVIRVFLGVQTIRSSQTPRPRRPRRRAA